MRKNTPKEIANLDLSDACGQVVGILKQAIEGLPGAKMSDLEVALGRDQSSINRKLGKPENLRLEDLWRIALCADTTPAQVLAEVEDANLDTPKIVATVVEASKEAEKDTGEPVLPLDIGRAVQYFILIQMVSNFSEKDLFDRAYESIKGALTERQRVAALNL